MHPLLRTPFILLAIALVAGTAGATIIGTEDVPQEKDRAITALSPGPTADSTLTGLTYADARAYYVAGSSAWSNAWGTSEIALIRQYLTEARTKFIYCRDAAGKVQDPANAANLALIRSVSVAYIDIANAALSMYDGADAYASGQAEMNAGSYGAAATSFGTAASASASSAGHFNNSAAWLQAVSYAGTEYGDGDEYTAAIVPILNGKAAYVGDYATYARAWQHTALAYQASANGDPATFRSEAALAMEIFAGLRSSPVFGADAASNYDILAGVIGSVPTIAPNATPTRAPYSGPTISPGVEVEPGLFRFSGAEVESVRNVTPRESFGGRDDEGLRKSTVDPMGILDAFPSLRMRDGYILRAYVDYDFLGASSTVFAMPADSPFPDPSAAGDGSLPAGADTAIMKYVQSDGTPESYLEATVFAIQAQSFAEYWHSTNWGVRGVVDQKPDGNYTYTEPDPAIWSPTVRMTPGRAEVVLHLYSGFWPPTGVWRLTDTYSNSSYAADRTVSLIAEVPSSVIY